MIPPVCLLPGWNLDIVYNINIMRNREHFNKYICIKVKDIEKYAAEY